MVARTSILFLGLLSGLCLVGCSGASAPTPATPPPTLEAHARAQDDEGLREASAALKTAAPAQRMVALAALLEYDPGKVQPLVPMLEERATHAPSEAEKSAAAWVLVRAGDANVVPAALTLYGTGAIEQVRKLGGARAFDPVELARLVAPATAPDALAGLRRKVLLTALPSADSKLQPVFVRALLADTDEGVTLVSLATMLTPQKDFGVLEQVFRRILMVSDPRAADALASYADHATHPHFRTLAALALAGLGDMRAAPHLAWRIAQDPKELYDRNDPNAVRLTTDDNERIYCVRRLADLVEVHPEARTQLRELVEAPLLAWVERYPHAAALRVLVDVESAKVLPILRKLADPATPIPAANAGPPLPEEFVEAQTALRLLGRSHDASAKPILEKQLTRKPAAFDGSMEALERGGAVAGLVYQSLAIGAADGFMEGGDAKAVPTLVKTADDPKESERARFEACRAVGWLADAAIRREIVAKVKGLAGDRKRETMAACWLMSLDERPLPEVDSALVSVLSTKTSPATRHHAARVLGQGGVTAADRPKLEAMLKDPVLVHDAALALLLGGDAAGVGKALAAYQPSEGDDATAPPIEPLRQLYAQSVGELGEQLVASGALARMASLALAARSVTVRGAKQDWVLQGFAYQLRERGQGDAGPHTMTRTRFLAKLLADAKGADAQKRDEALLLLWVLGERASLAAVGDSAHLAEPSP